MRGVLVSIFLVCTTLARAADSHECNAELGKQVFALCSACHALGEADGMRPGPPLRGVFGKPAASIAKYNYSPALRASALTWDAATLDRFLAKPARVLPGTLMTFPGLKSADDRAAVICLLRTLTP